MGTHVWASMALACVMLTFSVSGEGMAEDAGLAEGIYAEFMTSKGRILCVLEMEKTPLTVANFVGLAEGTLPNRVKEAGVPYYDGLKFHRVIPNFMIQGGCPLGTGTGGPGYRFPDEIVAGLTHNSAGILSMANAGPGTNGSQFFITHVPTPHLDGKHTVFGHVVVGQDVVDQIRVNDVMQAVRIIRVGAKADAFKGTRETFDGFKKALDDKASALAKVNSQVSRADAKVVADKLQRNCDTLTSLGAMDKAKSDWFVQAIELATRSQKSPKGSLYTIMKEGVGEKARQGQEVQAHYTGRLLDGTVFDSSVTRGETLPVEVGLGRVIPGWDEALLDMRVGEKRALFIPSDQAYGARGAGGVIPANAMLFFEVELVK